MQGLMQLHVLLYRCLASHILMSLQLKGRGPIVCQCFVDLYPIFKVTYSSGKDKNPDFAFLREKGKR